MTNNRWPYRVIVRHNGDIVGSHDGIPYRDKIAAQGSVDSYNKRKPGVITAELKEVKQ